ncbi:unnamed protein product [Dracunculus medinensis]|uniref:Linoleate 9S-lipoxygenase-4 n=1 Tax=Dracunculus medinensis TaxID=318479 RepID=A0A0N4U4K1_DRAME|nr:unnamed protein product [Dracunculus medinensis]
MISEMIRDKNENLDKVIKDSFHAWREFFNSKFNYEEASNVPDYDAFRVERLQLQTTSRAENNLYSSQGDRMVQWLARLGAPMLRLDSPQYKPVQKSG